MDSKKAVRRLVKKVVRASLSTNANSTTSISVFQPHAPNGLEKLCKINEKQ